MWPFRKKHFEWREPKVFRRTLAGLEATRSRWWHKPLAGFVEACLLMAAWGLARLNPRKEPPPFGVAVALAFAGGLFLVYFVSWGYRVAPSYIMVTDDRFFRVHGNH